jgi:hypothetical protein
LREGAAGQCQGGSQCGGKNAADLQNVSSLEVRHFAFSSQFLFHNRDAVC